MRSMGEVFLGPGVNGDVGRLGKTIFLQVQLPMKAVHTFQTERYFPGVL